MNLIKKLVEYAASTPDRVGYRYLPNDRDEESLTYIQLSDRMKVLAQELSDRGLEGQRVALMFPPGLDFVVALYACFAAGVVAVPLPLPSADVPSGQRMNRILKDCDPALVFTVNRLRGQVEDRLRTASQVPVPVHAIDDITDPTWGAIRSRVRANANVALIQYTSGSTGHPKGVLLTHSNLDANLDQIAEGFDHSRASSGVIWLPHFHDMGLVGGILQPLHVGFPVTLMAPAAFIQRPLRWLRAIDRYKATTSGGPNFAYDLCVQKAMASDTFDFDLSSWTVAFNGSEPVRAKTLDAFANLFSKAGFRRQAFVPCYGLAEASLLVASGRGGLSTDGPEPVSSGKPARGLTVTFCDLDRDRDRELDSEGDSDSDSVADTAREREILISGPNVSPGYWNMPARALDTPFATGDLGYLANGELIVTGRLKDMLVFRGRNVFAEDIEQTISDSHPEFRYTAGAAIGIDGGDGDGERLVYLHEFRRSALGRHGLNRVIEDASELVVAEHGIPVFRFIAVRVNSLPRTSSGKISRHACRTFFLDDRLPAIPIVLRPSRTATLHP